MRRLASYLNLRSLVFLLGVSLLWLAPAAPQLAWLDRTLFDLGSRPASRSDFALDLVELTDLQWRTLRDDPVAADEVFGLLDRLAGSGATVGLILPELPRREPYRAEALLAGADEGQLLHPEWSAQQQRRARLYAWLNSPQVVAGTVGASRRADAAPVATITPAPVDSWLNLLRRAEPYYQPDAIQGEAPVNAWPQGLRYPAAVPAELALLWRDGGELYPSVAAAILQRWLDSPAASWQQRDILPLGNWSSGVLQMGARHYPLGPGAALIPRASPDPETAPWLTLHSLEGFLSEGPGASLVLVALASDPAGITLATALRDLASQDIYFTPGWHLPLFWSLVLLSLIHLCLLLPRLSGGVALLLTCLWAVLMVAGQWGALLARGYWLPLGLLVQYLLLGAALIVLWRQQRMPVERLQQGYHNLANRLSRVLLEQGQVAEAHDTLRQCSDLAPVADALYEVGVHYERKRRFDEALGIYRQLHAWRPGFRDLVTRLGQLEVVPAAGATKEDLLAKTLISSPSHIRPLVGRYEVERELGRGAMGVVYLARDPRIARQVAIKTLSYDQFDLDELASVKMRFLREAEAAGRLRHPNIVTVYDVGEDQDLAFIAMDYVSGRPLSEAVANERLLPVEQVYKIIAQVADALDYAHEQEVIHRDVKPGNILFNSETGQAVVTDFGVARITSDARTQTGEILGSPVYMAPEQMAGNAVTAASDIFSLGVTFYQLLSGGLPFRADNLAALSYKVIHGKAVPLRDWRSGLPSSATRIINKALQKDPRMRFASAGEMARALRNASAKDF